MNEHPPSKELGSHGGPCQVPLVEQLRSTPLNAHHWIDLPNGAGGRNIPYGPWCHSAADEIEATRDMLNDARTELSMVREALGVPVEPHQTLSERVLEAARRAPHEPQQLEPPYRVRSFWSPCRKYIVNACVAVDDISMVDDNGDLWAPAGPEQDMTRPTSEPGALQKIIAAYDAYRSRGVAPAPNQYANLVAAIEAARATQPPRDEQE